MVNVEPLPGELSTATSPPSMVQKYLVMASPSPVPPKRLVVEASAWLHAANRRPSCSCLMPTPVSDTQKDIRASSSRAAFRVSVPLLVNLLAGVAQEIEQALLELGLVGAEAADIGGADHLDDVFILVGERLDDRQHLLDEGANVDLLGEDIHLPGFDLR